MRLLTKYPDVAHDSLYTAVVCGDLEKIDRVLTARPELANAKGGSRNWEPILYLCYARVELLLSRGADPSIRSKDGTTAADSARKRGLDRAADILTVATRRQRADGEA